MCKKVLELAHVAKWWEKSCSLWILSVTNFVWLNVYIQFQPDKEINLRIHLRDITTDGTWRNCPTIQQVTQTEYLGEITESFLLYITRTSEELRWVVSRWVNVNKNNDNQRYLLNEIYVFGPVCFCISQNCMGWSNEIMFLELDRSQRATLAGYTLYQGEDSCVRDRAQ